MTTKTAHVIFPALRYLVTIVVLVCCVGCAASGPLLYPLQSQEEPRLIYVVSHGWHTGIVIKRDDVDAHLWPEKDDFPEALYLEAGWGDRDFYQAPKAGVGILLQAALASPASVLFVIGMPTTVTQYFPGGEIIEIALSRRGLEELSKFIHATYKKDAAGLTYHWVLATGISTACFILPRVSIACSIHVTPGSRRRCRQPACL